ncbi:MAG: very short patch repair endonuclease [Endomicrobium sp.]|nr:very short patch repair endonuclease [Endomicrobium sp.]
MEAYLVFVKNKIAVFVDGCFWHRHNCRNIVQHICKRSIIDE